MVLCGLFTRSSFTAGPSLFPSMGASQAEVGVGGGYFFQLVQIDSNKLLQGKQLLGVTLQELLLLILC